MLLNPLGIGGLMELYVIAGPNGAGKTTFAREFLPNYANCTNFVNADLIAQGMAPFSPDTAAVRAGRLMLGEIRLLARRGESFAFETTLSGRSYMSLFRQLKARGYQIHIFFLWVRTADLALSRIRERVSKGGHGVPDPVVRRRFERSIRNFFLHYRGLADVWLLFDNSDKLPRVVALEKDKAVRIIDENTYTRLARQCGTP